MKKHILITFLLSLFISFNIIASPEDIAKTVNNGKTVVQKNQCELAQQTIEIVKYTIVADKKEHLFVSSFRHVTCIINLYFFISKNTKNKTTRIDKFDYGIVSNINTYKEFIPSKRLINRSSGGIPYKCNSIVKV